MDLLAGGVVGQGGMSCARCSPSGSSDQGKIQEEGRDRRSAQGVEPEESGVGVENFDAGEPRLGSQTADEGLADDGANRCRGLFGECSGETMGDAPPVHHPFHLVAGGR
jgi:hypothetical protein